MAWTVGGSVNQEEISQCHEFFTPGVKSPLHIVPEAA